MLRLAVLALALTPLLFSLPAAREAQASGIVSLSAGGAHIRALTEQATVKCWGRHYPFESYPSIDSPTPMTICQDYDFAAFRCVQSLTETTQVSAGDNHTCAVTAATGVKCWGESRAGALGDGGACGFPACPLPVDVCADATCSGPLLGVQSVAAGLWSSCAVMKAGTVKCWGDNFAGGAGDGTSGNIRVTPVDVCATGETAPCTQLLSGVVELSLGWDYTCALMNTGGVKCWGFNSVGRLGDGTTTSRSTPVEVVGLTKGVTAISAGDGHVCAVTVSGAAKCWGGNGSGALGTGTLGGFSAEPVDVLGLGSGTSSISAGGVHTCAITTGGAAKCWGNQGDGALGDGFACGQQDCPSPTQVSGLTSGVARLAAGTGYTCALMDGGQAKCWGTNFSGQLGDRGACFFPCPTPGDVFGLGVSPDADGDGCPDEKERGNVPELGGARDPKNPWDFFDTPNPANVRDGRVSIVDISRVVARFGSSGNFGLDPRSAPPPAPAYHTAFDRWPGGPEPWDLFEADGRITMEDIALAVIQFGHTCAWK